MELGEIDGFGHLASQPLRAGGRGLDQPALGGRPDREERLLLARLRAWRALQRPGRPGRVVRVLIAGRPGVLS